MHFFQVKSDLFYRYGNIFRNIINTPAHEWCALMDGLETNPFMKMCIDMIKDDVPQLFHKCPYQVSVMKFWEGTKIYNFLKGLLDLAHITLNNKAFMSTFPTGTYKLQLNFSESRTPYLFVEGTVEITSEIKTSF